MREKRFFFKKLIFGSGDGLIREGLDSLPSGIVFYNRKGTVILANDKMTELCYELFEKPLQNGNVFWDRLKSGKYSPGIRKLRMSENENGTFVTIRFMDGREWQFVNRKIETEEISCTEIMADDVTRVNRMNDELSRENERLLRMNERTRAYSLNVREYARTEELLSQKMRAHDELGRLLLETKNLMQKDEPITDEIWNKWNISAEEMIRGKDESGRDLLRLLKEMADSVGAEIITEGDMPESGAAARIFFNAGCECMTNMIKHAHARTLFVRFEERDGYYTARYENDGEPPTQTVTEGGGLSMTRKKVEEAGGLMEVRSTPVFTLVLSIPA